MIARSSDGGGKVERYLSDACSQIVFGCPKAAARGRQKWVVMARSMLDLDLMSPMTGQKTDVMKSARSEL